MGEFTYVYRSIFICIWLRILYTNMYIDRYSYVHVYCICIWTRQERSIFRRDRYLHMCIWYLYINRTLVSVDGSVIDNRFCDAFSFIQWTNQHTQKRKPKMQIPDIKYMCLVYVNSHARIHTLAHTYVYVYIYIYIFVYIYIHVNIYIYIFLYTYVYIYIFIYIYV